MKGCVCWRETSNLPCSNPCRDQAWHFFGCTLFTIPQLHFAVYESIVTGGRQILKPKFLVSLSFGMKSPNHAAPTVYNINSEPAVPIRYIATCTEGHALMSLHEMYHP